MLFTCHIQRKLCHVLKSVSANLVHHKNLIRQNRLYGQVIKAFDQQAGAVVVDYDDTDRYFNSSSLSHFLTYYNFKQLSFYAQVRNYIINYNCFHTGPFYKIRSYVIPIMPKNRAAFWIYRISMIIRLIDKINRTIF